MSKINKHQIRSDNTWCVRLTDFYLSKFQNERYVGKNYCMQTNTDLGYNLIGGYVTVFMFGLSRGAERECYGEQTRDGHPVINIFNLKE